MKIITNARLFSFIALLGIVLIFFQYHLWFESGGMRDMLQTKKMLNQQMAINEKLKKRNEELLSQIQRMQNGKDAAESRARNELGMIKSGETFYQIVPNEKIKG